MKTAILLVNDPAASVDPLELSYLINLADEIRNCGHSVEFVCCSLRKFDGQVGVVPGPEVHTRIRDSGHKIVIPHAPEFLPNEAENGIAVEAAYLAYEALKDKQYDVLHFQDRQGPAYYYLAARAQGLVKHPSVVCIHSHQPTLHRLVTGQSVKRGFFLPAICYMERCAIEAADFIYCLSEATAHSLKELNFDIAGKRVAIPPLETTLGRRSRLKSWKKIGLRSTGIEEFLFAAPLNQFHGFTTFIYAIDAMIKRGVVGFRVSVFGAADGEFDYRSLLDKYAANWPIKVKDLSSASLNLVQAKLEDPAVLLCLPGGVGARASLIATALAAGRPFLSTHRDSLFSDEKFDAYFVEAHHLAWADRMQQALEQGLVLPQVDASRREGRDWWDAECRKQAEQLEKVLAASLQDQGLATDIEADSKPLISVCIAHMNRPQNIEMVIDALKAQSYQNFEIIVVDDGSDPEHLETLRTMLDEESNVSLVEQENRYLGSARNTGARHAQGRYLLFHDDDNIARPDELKVLVEVAERTQADVLCCFSDVFIGNELADASTIRPIRRMPIGADVYYGLVRNGFGDSNCMVRKSVWEEVGGFSEHYRIGLDDHEFFARVVLAGYRLLVVPESLYYYRLNEAPMRNFHANRHADFVRVLDTYRDHGAVDPEMLPLLFAMRSAYKLR